MCAIDIFGISDHDLMFTQEKCDFEDEGEAEVDPGTDYIQHRVSITTHQREENLMYIVISSLFFKECIYFCINPQSVYIMNLPVPLNFVKII